MRVLVLLAAVCASGCADFGQTTVLTYQPDGLTDIDDAAQPLAVVSVYDVREQAVLERTSLGTSMGRIAFDPPETALIERLIESIAYDILSASPPDEPLGIMCGIRIFDVATPSTPVYWDMNVDVEIVILVGETERTAAGSATARTWVWPSRGRLQAVADVAFEELSQQAEVALRELLITRD